MPKTKGPGKKEKVRYDPVIGLEVHVQVRTDSKMFCGCPADVFGRKPNSAVCPVCLGLPGALPVPNRAAVEKTVLLAKALGCRIAEFSQFERKNYFYPDLPKGFQISQYQGPVGERGEFQGIAIRRVHLEEDTGKLIHEAGGSLIDFNRSGIPLIEIVTDPHFTDPARVREFLKDLRDLVVHQRISDADMEKGSMRLEANISLKPAGSSSLPEFKVELKNINSFAFLEKALREEIVRQEELLRAGRKVAQETRGYDDKKGVTFSQRRKEEAFDYRYFPEPDLPPLTRKSLKTDEQVTTLEETVGRYASLGVREAYAQILAKDRRLAEIFEELKDEMPAEEAANVIVNRRFGEPKEAGVKAIISAYKKEQEKAGLSGEEIAPIAEKIVLDNPQAVSDYASGKASALQFLFGQLMRETQGKVDPVEGQKILREILDARAKTT